MKRVIRQSSKNFLLDLSYIYLIICQATTDGEENGPEFAEPIPNVTVSVGRDASIPCVVNNIGTYKILWIHIDKKMVVTVNKRVISRIPRYSISVNNQNTWILHVTRVQQEDRGYYMCQINTNPIQSQVGYLQVIAPPTLIEEGTSPKIITVRENDNLTLTCRADGFPPPKIEWQREDGGDIILNKKTRGPLFRGEKLFFERISRTDMGGYTCMASNGVPPSQLQHISVNVQFSPIVMITNQLIAHPLGSNVILECQTDANPVATIYWRFKKHVITSSDKHEILTTSNSYSTLAKMTIYNVTTTDLGEYWCSSKNILGETEGSVKLSEYVTSTKTETLAPITTVHSTVFHRGTTEATFIQRIQNAMEKNNLVENIILKFNESSNLHSTPDDSEEFLLPKKITNSADRARWNFRLLVFGYSHIIIKFLRDIRTILG